MFLRDIHAKIGTVGNYAIYILAYKTIRLNSNRHRKLVYNWSMIH